MGLRTLLETCSWVLPAAFLFLEVPSWSPVDAIWNIALSDDICYLCSSLMPALLPLIIRIRIYNADCVFLEVAKGSWVLKRGEWKSWCRGRAQESRRFRVNHCSLSCVSLGLIILLGTNWVPTWVDKQETPDWYENFRKSKLGIQWAVLQSVQGPHVCFTLQLAAWTHSRF